MNHASRFVSGETRAYDLMWGDAQLRPQLFDFHWLQKDTWQYDVTQRGKCAVYVKKTHLQSWPTQSWCFQWQCQIDRLIRFGYRWRHNTVMPKDKTDAVVSLQLFAKKCERFQRWHLKQWTNTDTTPPQVSFWLQYFSFDSITAPLEGEL